MRLSDFVSAISIEKGWSGDNKYCVTDVKGDRFLLKFSPSDSYDRKKFIYVMMQKLYNMGIPMCKPVDFGICSEGVYVLESWIEGLDMETALPEMTDVQQYTVGQKAGQILKQIHSVTHAGDISWREIYHEKIEQKVSDFLNCGISFEGSDLMIDYIRSNLHLLDDRHMTLQHGDFHRGNLMISSDGDVFVIDFDRISYGDPWEDLKAITWDVLLSPHFASGRINGYFDGNIPVEFWRLLALYICVGTISSFPWAVPFGQSEIDTMLQLASEVLGWYGDFSDPVPKWYLKDFYIQIIDGIAYKLKAPFDFSFLTKIGTVFKVFDDQDSGNICFGCIHGSDRLFVKFAGAPTEQYIGSQQDAINRLKSTLPIYNDLRHPNLIDFLYESEIGSGYSMVFRWSAGECMGRMYPDSRRRFMEYGLDVHLKVYRDILSFLEHVVSQNYVAVDFYDGSVIYDRESNKTTICDIDLFRKMPTVNDMGRMWGSSRFMSPEEFELGASLDEVTNVYTAGAFAFALFSDYSRAYEDWTLSLDAYQVASKAVSHDRVDRYQSIQELNHAWDLAVGTN